MSEGTICTPNWTEVAKELQGWKKHCEHNFGPGPGMEFHLAITLCERMAKGELVDLTIDTGAKMRSEFVAENERLRNRVAELERLLADEPPTVNLSNPDGEHDA